jgi:hypothetical protein
MDSTCESLRLKFKVILLSLSDVVTMLGSGTKVAGRALEKTAPELEHHGSLQARFKTNNNFTRAYRISDA